LTHPDVQETLRLVDCRPTASGAEPLKAPPLTNLLVLLVQHYLNDLGYDAGPTDGLIGPRTRKAIRRLQSNAGRQSSGTIDFEVLRDLQRLQNASNISPE
jgi:peptidoglycan hydrolase-like protein with peptidoglycan-binding domain